MPDVKSGSTIKSAYLWVPTLYLMQGLPFALVTAVSVVLYKNFHFTNSKIAFYTSLFSIPWLLKPLFSPLIEHLAAKRQLIILTEFLMAAILLMLALSLSLTHFFMISGSIFFIMAFASSIHDINADGLYIVSLDANNQAYFVGIRTVFFQVGRFICQAGLIFLVGLFFNKLGVRTSWQWLLLLFALFWFIIPFYHQKVLPFEPRHSQASELKLAKIFIKIFKDFLANENLTIIIIFIIFYNFPENQLLKIVPLFLLDKTAHGGLGLTTAQVGFLLGGIGFIGMMAGVLLASFFLGKLSLKKCLVPMTIFIGITNLSYLLLSILSFHSMIIIGTFIAIAQFGYGISNGAYMYFILSVLGRGPYAMSSYTIGTGLMGLGVILGGATSGYLQYLLGYTNFFIWIEIISFAILLLSKYIEKLFAKENVNRPIKKLL